MEQRRLLFIDNLRVLAIVLVIMVHLSITYGGEGGWYLTGKADTISSVVLTLFNASCQAFFMGLLFFLSGYFTPGSYDRKGAWLFTKDRLLRLGIPMLCYDFVINPLLSLLLVSVGTRSPEGTSGDLLRSYYGSFHVGTGPLWFVEALLLFALAYVLWRGVRGNRSHDSSSRPWPVTHRQLIVLAFVLAAATFIVRLRLPLGWTFRPLNFQFPFFPQYICLYLLGIAAYRRDWLDRIPKSMGRVWLWVGAGCILVLLPVLFVLGGGAKGNIESFKGGLHLQSLAYAIWEQFVCVAMVIGLTVWFRDRFNHQSVLWAAASKSSYAAYVLHAPVIIVYAIAVQSIEMPVLPKFALSVLITVPLCFFLGGLVRKLPGAQRIL